MKMSSRQNIKIMDPRIYISGPEWNEKYFQIELIESHDAFFTEFMFHSFIIFRNEKKIRENLSFVVFVVIVYF